jgi:hydroxymethylbilane synthase
MTLRIGTRGSALARAQTAIVAGALGVPTEIVIVRTEGDASDRPFAELGDGVFVTAIEDALRRGEIDLAVHSLKDLPTGDRPGLAVAAILQREDPRDVLITRAREGIGSLPRGAVIGTSSARRDAFLRALRPDLITRPIRGNVDTRMAKVRAGEYDGTILALAGLRRLGLAVSDAEILDPADCPPAPGQGALAVQCRGGDERTLSLAARVEHADTRRAVEAEREVLRLLGGSCEIPLGTWGRVEDGALVLDAALPSDGTIRRTRARGSDPREVARRCANELGSYVHA